MTATRGSAWQLPVGRDARMSDVSRATNTAERSLKDRDLSTRWGRSERYRSGRRVTGGLVWPLPAPSGRFEALGRRPADLDRAAEALAERGRARSRLDPGPVEPPAPRRSATRVRACMPCQNAGPNGRSSPGRRAPATRAACPRASAPRRRASAPASAPRASAPAPRPRPLGAGPRLGPRPPPLGPREQPSGYRPL